MRHKTNQLINILRELLSAQTVKTQADIQQALEQRGLEANQSQISRSLHKLGAVKTKNPAGQVVYQLPKEPAPPSASPALQQLVIDIVHNEILLIIHTTPGSASLIARVLDHQQIELSILGTVAGDDTIMVIPRSIKTLPQTLQAIKAFLHINHTAKINHNHNLGVA